MASRSPSQAPWPSQAALAGPPPRASALCPRGSARCRLEAVHPVPPAQHLGGSRPHAALGPTRCSNTSTWRSRSLCGPSPVLALPAHQQVRLPGSSLHLRGTRCGYLDRGHTAVSPGSQIQLPEVTPSDALLFVLEQGPSGLRAGGAGGVFHPRTLRTGDHTGSGGIEMLTTHCSYCFSTHPPHTHTSAAALKALQPLPKPQGHGSEEAATPVVPHGSFKTSTASKGSSAASPVSGTRRGAVGPGRAGPLGGLLFPFSFCPWLLQPELRGQRQTHAQWGSGEVSGGP